MPSVSGRTEARRCLGSIEGHGDGPTLIVIGALHGNEPAGATALLRIVKDLETNGGVTNGRFVALVGNIAALAANQRFINRDLNRNWNRPRLQGRHAKPPSAEDREQQELSDVIDTTISASRGDVYLLDLHTTSAHSPPFTVFADTLKSRGFARHLPTIILLGVEEHLEGTLVDHFAARGFAAAAVEGGQHEDANSVDALEEAVRIALGYLRIVPRFNALTVTGLLDRSPVKLPRVLEIRVRHDIQDGDGFRMHPGFKGFEPVKHGQLLAADRSGEIRAPQDGYLIMPLYQRQGEEGFFIAKPVWRVWLHLSRVLRSARVDRIVHWLPGVRKDPTQPGLYRVNRRIARWFAMEILHLLGFRKLRDGDELLVASRLDNRR